MRKEGTLKETVGNKGATQVSSDSCHTVRKIELIARGMLMDGRLTHHLSVARQMVMLSEPSGVPIFKNLQ